MAVDEFAENSNERSIVKSKDKLAALCFFLGSFLFTVDGIGYCIEQVSWHSLCYTLGSALFLVGSGFMLV